MPRNILVVLDHLAIFLGPLVAALVLRDPPAVALFAALLAIAYVLARPRIQRRTEAFDFVEEVFARLTTPMRLSEVMELGPTGMPDKKGIVADLLHRGILRWDDRHFLELDETNLAMRKNEVFTRALGFALFFLIIALTFLWSYPNASPFLQAVSALIVVITLIKTAYLSLIPINLGHWG